MSWEKLIHRRAEKYVSALQENEMKSHVPLETGNPGRPLTDSTPASGHIHLRVTMERKNRYVLAARKRKMKLSEWMTETCDAASGLVTANADFRHGSEPLPARTGSLTGENEEKPNKSGTK